MESTGLVALFPTPANERGSKICRDLSLFAETLEGTVMVVMPPFSDFLKITTPPKAKFSPFFSNTSCSKILRRQYLPYIK